MYRPDGAWGNADIDLRIEDAIIPLHIADELSLLLEMRRRMCYTDAV